MENNSVKSSILFFIANYLLPAPSKKLDKNVEVYNEEEDYVVSSPDFNLTSIVNLQQNQD